MNQHTRKYSLGTASAIRILVANDLGLNPEFVLLAEMYLSGELFASEYSKLENAGINAVKLIQTAGLEKEALELSNVNYSQFLK